MEERPDVLKNVGGGVSVIIPAFNEGEAIYNTLLELDGYTELKSCEVIVVDDGSGDHTSAQVEAAAKAVSGLRIRGIRHRRNKGYGSAIKTGIRAAKGEIVVWYDADGQHRPEDLIKVINTMQEGDYDYCVGIRGKDSFVDRSRVFGKKILRLVINWMLRENTQDFNSGMRAFKKNVIMKYLSILPKRFGASTVSTFVMQEEEYAGCEVPIVVRQRIGKSTVKQFRDGFRTIGLVMNLVLLFRPKQVFGTLGVVFLIIGAIYSIALALLQHLGFPVLGAILIIFGLQIFCFGILSSQISQLRLESMKSEKELND